jgi:hypothetical protein
MGRVCFVAQRRWTLVVAAAAGALVLYRRGEKVWEPNVAMLAGCFAGGFVFIACTNEFLVRYILFIMPPLVLGVLLVLRRALVRPPLFAVAVAAILGAQATAWHPALPRTSEFEVEPNDDLSYRDMIDIGVRAADYVQRKHARAEIYGGFHERYELGESWQGYVEEPLDVPACSSAIRRRSSSSTFTRTRQSSGCAGRSSSRRARRLCAASSRTASGSRCGACRRRTKARGSRREAVGQSPDDVGLGGRCVRSREGEGKAVESHPSRSTDHRGAGPFD